MLSVRVVVTKAVGCRHVTLTSEPRPAGETGQSCKAEDQQPKPGDGDYQGLS